MCAVAIAALERVQDDPVLAALQRQGGTTEVSFVQ
jgi:hypothetical protein